MHLRLMPDNITRCITLWCYHRSACSEFAQNYKWFFVCWNSHFANRTTDGCYPHISSCLFSKHLCTFKDMQTYVDVSTSVTIRIWHASEKNRTKNLLFSFSSPSFHSSFPTCPLFTLHSLFTTCETYAMWLMLELPNLLYSLPHHCQHMFLSFIVLHDILVW